MNRLLILLLLMFTGCALASLRPVSSISLPQEMASPAASASPQAVPLRVGILQNGHSPWNMVVGHDLYGINADYLVVLEQTSGLRATVTGYTTQQAMFTALRKGEIDLLFGVPQQPLPSGFSATQPWYSSPLRIYRNRNNLRPVMFNSASARIAVSRDTLPLVNADFSRRHHWQLFDSDLQALSTLLNQRSDYVVADETTAGFLLSQLQQGEIFQLESSLAPGTLQLEAIGRDPATIRWLDMAIRQLPMEVINGIQGRWNSTLPRYQDTNTARLTPMERSWIEQHPTLIYAAVSDDYPWSYRSSNGQPAGYSVDLLNSIGQLTGLHFVPYWVNNAQQAQALVSQGQAQIQLTLPLTGNDDMLGNTQPVWRALWGVYTRQEQHGIIGWQDLAGKRVGIKRGDIARQMLPAGVTPVIFEDSTSLYDALANGQIDALSDNVLSARWRIQSHYAGLQLAFAASDTAWPVAIGIARDKPLLRALLNNGLQQIPQETWQRLRESWSSTPDGFNDGSRAQMRPVSLLLLVTALGAIIILLILLVKRYLEQRRDRRQRLLLEQEREVAQRENRMKSQFLATVSHELRTPMQAVLGLLELELAQQPLSKNLPLIRSSASGLLNLLNDLQDHAKLENNSFSLAPRPLEPEKWLQQLSTFYHPLMRSPGPLLQVSALTPLPDWVLIDAERLQQIANNLIANAIKFTAQGEINVTLAAENNPSRLHLQVKDSGSGIPLDEQQRLFEPWYQPPSGRQLSVQGSGLGLSICREIIEHMAGSISLTSTPGVGTCVNVILPWQLITPPETALRPQPGLLPARGLRVAIVDDHPTNLLVMQQQLAHCGVTADTFTDGRALLQASTHRAWDVLFIDYSMPHPDGLTLARILRRRQRHDAQRTRIVLCSADAHILNQSRTQATVDRVLLKPVSLSDIAAQLAGPTAGRFADLPQRIDRLAHQDPHYVQRLCQTLSATLRQDCQALRSAAASEQWHALESSAHRMKGSWMLLGYDEEEKLCQQVVTAARAQQKAEDSVELLISLSESLLSQLESYDKRA